MSRDHDNEFEEFNEENNETRDYRRDTFREEIDASQEKQSRSEEPSRQPWNRRFGQDENPKNRQYSRTSRNQPAQEANTLSRVLLIAIVLFVLLPFILWGVISAQRDNDEIAERTTEQVMISRNSEESVEEESSESESSSESSSSSSQESSSDRDESVRTADQTPQTGTGQQGTQQPPTQPTEYEDPTAPDPTSPDSGAVHTVAAGETWYGIARTYGIDVYDLVAANGATIDTPIHPGTAVVIP